MYIRWLGYLAKSHSWGIVGQQLCREFIRLNHKVDMYSSNGIEHFPEDLKPYLKGSIEDNPKTVMKGFGGSETYDMQMSYTALPNFSKYFLQGSKNRMGIWNYETSILPKGFGKYHQFVDQVLPSSQFSKDIFAAGGIPESKQTVIPHGIHLERFHNLGKYSLKTNKRYKILANIAQPHLRKNIPGLLKAYGKAFTKNDDVCLVLKIAKKSPQAGGFDVDFESIYKSWQQEFRQHGEVEIIDTFITDIEPLYNACDIGITMAHCEGFHMPSLEMLAANKIVIAPRYGGQLDFLNDANSILIGGKIIRADNRMQYWEASPYAKCFDPDIEEAVQKLRDVVANYGDYHRKFSPKMQETVQELTWRKAAEKILNLCH